MMYGDELVSSYLRRVRPSSTSHGGTACRIGLTGGIASGKSNRRPGRFVELGVPVIDADESKPRGGGRAGQAGACSSAREVWQRTWLARMVKLDRARSARADFQGSRAHGADLEAILHPLIRRRHGTEARNLAVGAPYVIMVHSVAGRRRWRADRVGPRLGGRCGRTGANSKRV